MKFVKWFGVLHTLERIHVCVHECMYMLLCSCSVCVVPSLDVKVVKKSNVCDPSLIVSHHCCSHK